MDSKIVERIKRLLALATSDNENEAAAASAAAARLMFEHKIEQATIDLASGTRESTAAPEDVPLGTSCAPWEAHLATGIARANGCDTFVSSRSGARRVHVFGLPCDTQTTAYLFAYLSRVVRNVSARECGGDRRYGNAFRLGMAVRLGKRLAEAKAAHETELSRTSDCFALAVVQRDAMRVRSAFTAVTANMRQGRPSRIGSSGGFAAGQAAANSVQLSGGKALSAGASRLRS